jgi:hypothetical protein
MCDRPARAQTRRPPRRLLARRRSLAIGNSRTSDWRHATSERSPRVFGYPLVAHYTHASEMPKDARENDLPKVTCSPDQSNINFRANNGEQGVWPRS